MLLSRACIPKTRSFTATRSLTGFCVQPPQRVWLSALGANGLLPLARGRWCSRWAVCMWDEWKVVACRATKRFFSEWHVGDAAHNLQSDCDMPLSTDERRLFAASLAMSRGQRKTGLQETLMRHANRRMAHAEAGPPVQVSTDGFLATPRHWTATRRQAVSIQTHPLDSTQISWRSAACGCCRLGEPSVPTQMMARHCCIAPFSMVFESRFDSRWSSPCP